MFLATRVCVYTNIYKHTYICNSDYLRLSSWPKAGDCNGPNRHCKHFRPSQNGHKKWKIATLEIMRQTSFRRSTRTCGSCSEWVTGREGVSSAKISRSNCNCYITLVVANGPPFSSCCCQYTALHGSVTIIIFYH